MDHAYKLAKTDKVIIFDGVAGGINCSESLAELLMEKAPEVSREVDEKLMPKWLKQRALV
jgi:serine/threonine protein phosphatase PrpC